MADGDEVMGSSLEGKVYYGKDDLEKTATATKAMLQETFALLTKSAQVRTADEGERFFFPKGVNLIDVTVKLHAVGGIEFSVKLQGP